MKITKRGRYWWIDFTHKGRRYRFSLQTTQKTVAQIIMKDIEARIAKGEFLGTWRNKPPLFEAFLDEYLEYAKMNKSRKGFEQDYYTSRHLRKFFGGYRLDQITPDLIEQYKRMRVKKVKPITVNRDLQVLRAMFNRAVAWGLIDQNPMKKVQFFKEPPGRLRYLSKEEIVRLINAATGYMKVIIILALNTGMRRGEILSLEWSDIDFENRIIIVRQSKTNERRIIPMNDLVYKTLKEWRKHTRGKRLFRIKSFKRSWKTTLKKAGITDFRFHDLRHTFASYLVMNSTDLRTVAELLGHKTLRMVQRYSHLSDEHMKIALERLGTNLAQLHFDDELKPKVKWPF